MTAIIDLINSNPILGMAIVSLIVTVVMTVIRFFATDRKLMKEIKEKQKSIREEMKKHKDDVQKMSELNKEMMQHLPAQLKESFKIMLITLIPLLILLKWLRTTFEATPIAHSWIWWYIGFSMLFGIILGKVFKLD